MKRRYILDFVLIILIALLAICFQQNEQRNDRSQLNRNGLSENSLLLSQGKSMAVSPLIDKLSKSSITNFQLQLVSIKNPNFSYIYAKGKQGTLIPTTSGRFFNLSDFKSEVPFVVLGEDLEKDTYQPQSQMYYKYNQQYLAVIGVAGTSGNLAINDHVFVSLSPNQTDTSLLTSDYRIVYDPLVPNQRDTKKIQNYFTAKKATKLVDSSTVNRERQGWFERSGLLITQLILIVVLMIVIAWALIYLVLLTGRNFKLIGFLKDQLTLKLLSQVAIHLILTSGLGFIIGWQVTKLAVVTPLVIIIVSFDVIALILTGLYLNYSHDYIKLKTAVETIKKESEH